MPAHLPDRILIAGRRVLVVDDSPPNDQAIRQAADILRQLGALEVHTLALFASNVTNRSDYQGPEVRAVVRPGGRLRPEGFSGHSDEPDMLRWLLHVDRGGAESIGRRIREIADRVRDVQAQDLYFYLAPVESLEGARVTIAGRPMLLGSSYSYLGLLGHPAVEAAARRALEHYGTGTHGVRLLAGNTDLHNRLEERIAAFVGAAEAIVYSSGYIANVAAISALVGRGDIVVCDKLNHASIIDGCILSGARFTRVPHKDVAAVDRVLAESPAGTGKLLVVDAVFSLDGDMIDLPAVVEVCQRRGAWLMVDESHSLGVLGARGQGIEAHFGLPGSIDVKMGSLSKSIPSVGGFIVGAPDLVTYLKHVSRPFVFSAALPPASVAAAIAAIDVIAAEPERVARLQAHARRLRDALRAGGVPVRDDPTPIVPIITGEAEAALRMARFLFDRGIFVPPILPPAVPPHTSRLRTTVTAAHTEDEVEAIAAAVIAAWHEVVAGPVDAHPARNGWYASPGNPLGRAETR